METPVMTQKIRANEARVLHSGRAVVTVRSSRRHIQMPKDGKVEVYVPAVGEPKDFGTRWNERMDELGAERGSVQDLLAI